MSKIYHARYEFFSRCNNRKTQYSTKHLKQIFDNIGLTMETVPGYYGTLIQMVRFSGTCDEVIKIRTDIADRLRILTNGNMSLRFKVEK